MRAVRHARYGGPEVLQIVDVDAPTPGRGEVLVRVHAAALNPKDVLVRKGKFRWFTFGAWPRATGLDLCGEVIAVGAGVTQARVGERVWAMLPGWLGGAVQERAVVPEGCCGTAPASLSDAQAAAVPLAALTALQALRDDARVGRGARVVIHGASGGVGTFAIQLAKDLGAHVTTTSGAANHALCRELGADETLDYRVDDPLARRDAWDCVFDVFGNRSFAHARAALAAGGTYVTTVPSPQIVVDTARTLVGGKRARLVVVRSRRVDLDHLAARVAAGALRPVVDRVFPMDQIVDAHRYLATKRARGKVVITIS